MEKRYRLFVLVLFFAVFGSFAVSAQDLQGLVKWSDSKNDWVIIPSAFEKYANTKEKTLAAIKKVKQLARERENDLRRAKGTSDALSRSIETQLAQKELSACNVILNELNRRLKKFDNESNKSSNVKERSLKATQDKPGGSSEKKVAQQMEDQYNEEYNKLESRYDAINERNTSYSSDEAINKARDKAVENRVQKSLDDVKPAQQKSIAHSEGINKLRKSVEKRVGVEGDNKKGRSIEELKKLIKEGRGKELTKEESERFGEYVNKNKNNYE